MDQHAVFLLLGLANGAVFAGLALALVVTYRSSGVINFATGAIALFSAYFFVFLRRGELLIPVPGLPQSIALGGGLTVLPAIAVTLLLDALLGIVLYLTTFRPLRDAPPVAKAVASIGAMVVITGLITLRFGTNAVSAGPIFPTDVLVFGDIRVSVDRIWFAVTVIALTIVIISAYRFTQFGLHTRAAAESEKGAYVSRISPDRIAALNWVISAVVAGLVGILISPVAPLVPYSYTLFIVPALAAAIVGGFERLGVAVAAGIAIGMLQSEATYLQTQYDWLPSSGLADLIPLVLIVLVFVVRAKPLPSRGAIARSALARAPRPERLVRSTVLGVAAGAVLVFVLQGSFRAALVTSFVFAIIGLSIVVITGIAGQVSFAQLTLAGVAGFALSPLTVSWGVPFPIAPVLAALFATAIGVLVGLPALRIRGLPVAIVTLSLAVALQALWFRNVDYVGSGGKPIAEPKLFGLSLSPGTGSDYPRPQFCLMVLVVLALTAIAVAHLRRSSLGSAMLAVRANERSASASGINVVATKITAFAIAAFIAGIGGSLLGYKLGTVSYDSYDVLLGLGLFATVYLAGITSVSGGVLSGVLAAGGILSYASTEWFSLSVPWYSVITGVAVVVAVVKFPEGIVGSLHQAVEGRRRPAGPRPSAAPVEAEPAASIGVGATREHGTLSVRDLGVRYGGVVAVDGVTFEVPRGEIVGLIGPNGAGKTTVIDAISGFCSYRGSVSLDGEPLDSLVPYQRIRRGLGRTFQGIELWTELTVAENVLVGPGAARRPPEEVDALFALLRLDQLRDRPASELSQGQRQLVSIARSLISQPGVLLLDEPAAGLDSTESSWLADRLREVRDAGITVLLVDHDMALVLNLCDRIEVLDQGAIIASGPPAAIRSNRDVADAYLGKAPAGAP